MVCSPWPFPALSVPPPYARPADGPSSIAPTMPVRPVPAREGLLPLFMICLL